MFLHRRISRALTAALAAVVAVPVYMGATTVAHAATQQIGVNLGADTGAVYGGADGALYGLSQNGVPSADLLTPLHIRTIAQGPPGAAQHPTGHADQVVRTFVGSGGKQLLVYLQDYYSAWPYQNVGISAYESTVDTIAAQIVASPYRSHYVYVPFNEPDNIWYSLPADITTFESDWATIYHRIKADDPSAVIAGPNTAGYNTTTMTDFLTYAKANGVLPDILTWHELQPASLQNFPTHVANVRALESSLGISPRQIDIDEYGDRRDLSDPGQLVQWISMFENAKVDADMAFWDIADDYSDTTVETAKPNGSWWLFDWYGQLTGDTVAVTPPSPDSIDTLQGVAALDTSKKQARVIIGGTSSPTNVVLSNIPSSVFGGSVHVSVQSTSWSGYDGSAYTPRDIAEGTYTVSNGSITVPVSTTDPMAAYQLIITPSVAPVETVAATTWTASYEAENAALTDATVYSQGSQSNYNGYATSGGEDVGSIDNADSRVVFTVNVPYSGTYRLSVFYGNQTEAVAQQIFRVDSGSWSYINYPATLNWTFRSHKDLDLTLSAGTHTLTFGVSDSSFGTATGQVTMDRIDLAYAATAVPGYTESATHYAQSQADLSGGVSTFAVEADADGYYTLHPDSWSSGGSLYLDGTYLKAATSSDRVFLHAGINLVSYTCCGTGLDVTPDTSDSATTYEAESSANTLAGTAAVESNTYASGGEYVGWIGNGSGNTLTFNGITAPSSGTYRLAVTYANDERAGSGNYNANLVERAATITTSAGTNETVYFRNTYAWNQWDTVVFNVTLAAGTNTITFANPTAYTPDIDKIAIAKPNL